MAFVLVRTRTSDAQSYLLADCFLKQRIVQMSEHYGLDTNAANVHELSPNPPGLNVYADLVRERFPCSRYKQRFEVQTK